MVEKQIDKIRRSFLEGAVRITDEQHARLTSERVQKTWRRILQSFVSHPDGGQLADGLVEVTRYFSELGFWRGYKNAKRHYATMNAVKRTPDGRQEIHRAIEEMLEKDINLPAEKVCEQLDQMGLSASFDLKINGKQKTIHVGSKSQFRWKHVRKEDSLKNMISRLRARVTRERKTTAWMKLSDRAFPSGQH